MMPLDIVSDPDLPVECLKVAGERHLLGNIWK